MTIGNKEAVTLNVGGQKFTTLVSTLRRFSDFKPARMLDGSDQAEFRVVNGQFFVDRDGSLFKYILDYLRTPLVSPAPDFFDYEGLTREAGFYEIRLLVYDLSRQYSTKAGDPGGSIFSSRESHVLQNLLFTQQHHRDASCEDICVCRRGIDKLELCIPTSKTNGSRATADMFTPRPYVPMWHKLLDWRYVTIQPDRKLINGTTVLGSLVDILLKEGFRLIGTRTVSSEEKVECYTFERIKRPQTLTINDGLRTGHANHQTKLKENEDNTISCM